MQRRRYLSVWRYFGLVYLWSWLGLVPVAVSGLHGDDLVVVVLRALAGLGPMVVALGVMVWTQDAQARREYWLRLIDPGRIHFGWYAVILLTVPLLTGLAVFLDHIFGGGGALLEARFQANLWGLLPLAVFTLFFGPLPEEMGWRGYALDRLQERYNAFTSSLVLGIIWALWHLPLFFISGTYQHRLGVGTTGFWIFMLTIPLQAIFFTWIFNHNHRSTLSAVLFHFAINYVGELFDLTARAEIFLLFVWAAGALAIVTFEGPKKLMREAAG
jgi:membrane protease YdiL (CAAX protease family)